MAHYGLGMFFAWTSATAFIILLALAFLWRFRGGKWRSMRVIEEPVRTEPIPPGAEVSPCAGEEWLARKSDGVVSSSSPSGIREVPEEGEPSRQ